MKKIKGVILALSMASMASVFAEEAAPVVPGTPGIQVLESAELPGGLKKEKLRLRGFDPDEAVPGIAIHPAEGGPFPLVIVLHYLRGSKESLEDWSRKLAGRGFFALAIDACLHGERSIDGIFHGEDLPSLGREYSIFVHQVSIARTAKDVSVILDDLSRRPDVDVSRAAALGMSMGGSTALVLAWREPRIKTVVSLVGAVDFWWDVTKLPPGPEQDAKKASYGPRLKELVNSIDPLPRLRRIPPKAVFLANGGRDGYIDLESIRKFVRDLEPLYGDREARDCLRLLEVPEAGHEVTEAMWSAAEEWLVRHAMIQAQSCAPLHREHPGRLTSIHVDGGYGYLRCFSLEPDGSFKWTGYEPERKAISLKEGKLSPDETTRLWELACRVDAVVPGNSYLGGEHTCTIELRFSDRTRNITVQGLGKDQAHKDQRPEPLANFMDSLWATRNGRIWR